MDKGSLYNLALAYLGKSEYEGRTPEAESVEKLLQHCIALALDSSTWTFATRRATLQLDKKAHSAELPADCLRVQKIDAGSFEIFGGRLYVNAPFDEVGVTYTSNEYVQNVYTPDGQPTFDEAVALLLAAKIAPKLTSSFNLANELERKAQIMLSRAKLKDARQWASNDQAPRGSRETWGAIPFNVLVE